MKKKIIIVSGDPNSINSEIIGKTWKKLNKNLKKKVYLIGNFKLLTNQYKKLKIKINLKKIENLSNNIPENYLKIIDLPLNFKNPFKVSLKNSSKYIINSLNLADKLIDNKNIKGFINCPIDKRLIKTNKIHGVTEFLGMKSKLKKSSEVMMLHNKKLSVVPITTHQNIKNVSDNISSKKIFKKVTILNSNFKKLFKKKPKIAILGLNPHNAELSKKSEEVTKIIPAVQKLKSKKFNVKGPFVADTFFMKDYKKYDVIVGMYHDQVLIPFKTLFKFDAINITLGLNYIRVSPDHGTAINLIGKNKANYHSLLQCVKFINNLN